MAFRTNDCFWASVFRIHPFVLSRWRWRMTCKFSRSFLHIWELPFQIESNSQKGKFTLKYPYHPFRVIYRSPQISLANEKALIKLSSNSPLDISFFVITILKRAEVRLEDWVYAQILCRPPSSPKNPQQPQFWGVGSQSNRWTLRVNSLENLVLLHPKWTSKVVHWIENLNLYITQKIDLSITSLFHGFQEQGGGIGNIFSGIVRRYFSGIEVLFMRVRKKHFLK